MPLWNGPVRDGWPWVNHESSRSARRLFRYYGPLIEGANVYIMNDDTVTETPYDWEQIRVTLHGAHIDVEITDADAALLIAAGYGAYVT